MATFTRDFSVLADVSPYTSAEFTKLRYGSSDAAITSGVLHATTAGTTAYTHVGSYSGVRTSEVTLNYASTATAQTAFASMLAADGSGFVLYAFETKLRIRRISTTGAQTDTTVGDFTTTSWTAPSTARLSYNPSNGELKSYLNGTLVKTTTDTSKSGTELKPGVVLYLSGASQTPLQGATAMTATGVVGEFDSVVGDYFVSAAGSNANDGSAASPWATLAHARATITTQATVIVGAGTFAKFTETVSPAKPLLMFKAAPGTTPVLSGLSITYAALASANLVFNGIKLYTAVDNTVGVLTNVRNLTVVASEVTADKWSRGPSTPVDGLSLDGCSNVRLYTSKCYGVMRPIKVANSAGTVVSRNLLKPTGGSGVQYLGGNTAGVIEYNHITSASYVTYPTDPLAYNNPHQSAISVRSSDLMIRGNQIHHIGNSSAIMFYEPDTAGGEAAYSNITLDGNLIYDIFVNTAVRIYNCGPNVVFKNNFIASRKRLGDCDGLGNDARYRYETAIAVQNYATGYSGTDLTLENNVIAGILSLPSAPTERNNIIWAYHLNLVWTATPVGWTSTVLVSDFLGCGSHPLTLEDGTVLEPANDLMYATADPITLSVTSAAQTTYLDDDFENFRSAEVLNANELDFDSEFIDAPAGAYDETSLWAQIRTETAAFFKASPLSDGLTWVSPHTKWTAANAVLAIDDVVAGGSQILTAQTIDDDGTVTDHVFDTAYVVGSVVTDLAASVLSSTSIRIKWTAKADFTYNPRYRKAGDPSWTTMPAASRLSVGILTATAAGLDAATQYEFDLTATEATSNAASATTAPASGIVTLPIGGFGGGATFEMPLHIDYTLITGVTYAGSVIPYSASPDDLLVTIPSGLGIDTYDLVITTSANTFTYPVIYVQLTPFVATARLATVAADGRYPGLPFRVPKIKPAEQVGVTNLAVTTTETTATLTFTPVPGATVYLFQRAIGGTWGGDKYSDGKSGTMSFTGLVANATYLWRVFADGVVSNVVTKATLAPSGGGPTAGNGGVDTTPPPGSFPGVRRLQNPEWVFIDDMEGARNTSVLTGQKNASRGVHPETPGTLGSKSQLFHFAVPGTPLGVDGQNSAVTAPDSWAEVPFTLPINAKQLEISYDFYVPSNFVQVGSHFKGFFTIWSGTYGGYHAELFVVSQWIGSEGGAVGGPTPMLNVCYNKRNPGNATITGSPLLFPNRAGRWYHLDALIECAPGPGQFGKVEVKVNGNLVIGTHHPQLKQREYVTHPGSELLGFATNKNYFEQGYLFGWVSGAKGAVQEKYTLGIDKLRIAANSEFGPITTGAVTGWPENWG